MSRIPLERTIVGSFGFWSHCLGAYDWSSEPLEEERLILRCPKLLGTFGAILNDPEIEFELAAGPPCQGVLSLFVTA
jgi:hypothetical protein